MTTTGAPQFRRHRGKGSGNPSAPHGLSRNGRRWIIAGIIFVGVVLAAAIVIAYEWPYRHRKIKPMLEETFGCQIQMRQYHRTYFPSPGFVARGITLRRRTALNLPPIATVEELYVQSNWTDFLMFRQRVSLFQIVHVHLVLPPPNSPESRQEFPPGSSSDFEGPQTPIQHFEVRDMRLEVRRAAGGSYVFPVSELHIENMKAGRPWTYAVAMGNAIPTGNIVASGQFGPLGKNPGATPVSGQFRFTRVNLHDVGNIRGIASAFGTFRGPLGALQTEATTAVPDFAVNRGIATPVAGALRCIVNGLNGDVLFQNMELRVGTTLIHASGKVDGSPHATNLDIDVKAGRVQDVMRPFLHRDVPVTGAVSLQAHAYLAPVRAGPFLHRLHITGTFSVPQERLTDTKAEKSLTAFSQRAQGAEADDAEQAAQTTDAVSSLAGPAEIADAVVTTRGLTFQVPGADARLHGTFNFRTEAVHLTGKLAMRADLSHAATGFKSFLLKPLAPFFHKHHAGALISIAVTGTPGKYQVQQDIGHRK
jgi:hypothetical protein